MTKNECFALDNHTCDYPEDATFEEVLDLIEQMSDDVTIWEPFENDFPASVIEKITEMVSGLDSTYPEGKKELT